MSNVLKEIQQERELNEKQREINNLKFENSSIKNNLEMYKARFGEINVMDKKSYDITISLDEYRWLVSENMRLQIDNERLNNLLINVPIQS